MKHSNTILTIGIVGLGIYLLSKNRNEITVGKSGLNRRNYTIAARKDVNGTTWADWVLSSPNASTALNRGNAVLQMNQGLDLTDPIWSLNLNGPEVPVNEQVINGSPGPIFDYRGALAISQASSKSQNQIIIDEPSGGTFPRMIGNIYVSNPNQLEHLKHTAYDVINGGNAL